MSPLPQRKAKGKGVFFELHFDVVLLFGMTELKAQIAWEENVSGFDLPNRFTDGETWPSRELRNGKFPLVHELSELTIIL